MCGMSFTATILFINHRANDDADNLIQISTCINGWPTIFDCWIGDYCPIRVLGGWGR